MTNNITQHKTYKLKSEQHEPYQTLQSSLLILFMCKCHCVHFHDLYNINLKIFTRLSLLPPLPQTKLNINGKYALIQNKYCQYFLSDMGVVFHGIYFEYSYDCIDKKDSKYT